MFLHKTDPVRAVRLWMITLTVAAMAAFSVPALAANAGIYSADGKVAIKGADAVAYFTEGRPVYGKAEFAYRWMGAEWRFASAANRDKFKANPGKYAPQYGGYCAYAVSYGSLAKIEPEAWKIVDGKLYLNFNKSIQQRWERSQSKHIARADKNWPGVLKK